MARRIGELLVLRGVHQRDEVDRAAQEARARGTPLLSFLLLAGTDEGALAGALAERHHMPGVDLSRSTSALDAIGQVPAQVAETDAILPLSLEGGRLHLAMSQPLDERVVSEVRFVTGLEVSPYAAVKHAPWPRPSAAAYDAARARARCSGAARTVRPRRTSTLVLPSPADADDDAIEIVDDADVAEAEPAAEWPSRWASPSRWRRAATAGRWRWWWTTSPRSASWCSGCWRRKGLRGGDRRRRRAGPGQGRRAGPGRDPARRHAPQGARVRGLPAAQVVLAHARSSRW